MTGHTLVLYDSTRHLPQGDVVSFHQDLPKPSEAMIRKWLAQSAWSARAVTIPLTSFTPKSETGKTGLVNLGNTCYINSVLQALYMLEEWAKMLFFIYCLCLLVIVSKSNLGIYVTHFYYIFEKLKCNQRKPKIVQYCLKLCTLFTKPWNQPLSSWMAYSIEGGNI